MQRESGSWKSAALTIWLTHITRLPVVVPCSNSTRYICPFNGTCHSATIFSLWYGTLGKISAELLVDVGASDVMVESTAWVFSGSVIFSASSCCFFWLSSLFCCLSFDFPSNEKVLASHIVAKLQCYEHTQKLNLLSFKAFTHTLRSSYNKKWNSVNLSARLCSQIHSTSIPIRHGHGYHIYRDVNKKVSGWVLIDDGDTVSFIQYTYYCMGAPLRSHLMMDSDSRPEFSIE